MFSYFPSFTHKQLPSAKVFFHVWVQKTSDTFIHFFYFWHPHFQKRLHSQIFEDIKQFSFDFFNVISPFTVPSYKHCGALFFFFSLFFAFLSYCMSSVLTTFSIKEAGSWDPKITILLNSHFRGSAEKGKDLQFMFNNWSGAAAKAEY